MNQILAIFDTINAQKETVIAYAKFAGILVFGLLLISSLFRFIFGKKAQLNHAVSSAVEILCLYVINIVIYSLGLHWKLFLSPLPFMSIEGDYLHVMPVLSSDFSLVCGQVLKVVIIAFVVNILEAFMPKGKRLLSWYFFRLLTVVLAVGAIVGLPAVLEREQQTTPLITTQSLGDEVTSNERALLDLGGGEVNISNRANAPEYRSIWAKGSNGSFPMVGVNGAYYRMMTTPSSVSSSLLGASVGSVAEFTTEPSLSGTNVILSNQAAIGTPI